MKFKLFKLEWSLFIGFGLILFIIPYVFTRNWGILPIDDVGGTIGGITAPFLGFFGSLLVYFALKAQVEANQQIQNQIRNQEIESKVLKRAEHFKNRITIIQYEINNFYYSFFLDKSIDSKQKMNYEGSQAIHKLLGNSKDNYYGKKVRTPYELEPKLVELRSLLVFFELTILEIRNDVLIDLESKIEIVNILKYIFESKISANFKIMEEFKSKHNKACPENCGNFHGIPTDLFELVESIKIKIDATL